jgi:GNAT superfamily N-acetyltransferase
MRKIQHTVTTPKNDSDQETSHGSIRPFRESDVDFVISRQLALYKREYGFTSAIWKEYLTGGVHNFVRHFDPARDCMYIFESNGTPGGCIAITHRDGATAQLRFFFVERTMRGRGAGHLLMDAAIGFCNEKKYEQVFLWTFSTLDAARHLYESKEFRIMDIHTNNDWGEPILEERWDLEM